MRQHKMGGKRLHGAWPLAYPLITRAQAFSCEVPVLRRADVSLEHGRASIHRNFVCVGG